MTLKEKQRKEVVNLINGVINQFYKTIANFTENQTARDYYHNIADLTLSEGKLHDFLEKLHNELNGEKI